MAGTAHIPLNQQPDVVRWLPALSPLQADRPLALAAWDYRTCSAHLHALILSPPQTPASSPVLPTPRPTLSPIGAWQLPARASRLAVCALPDGRSLLLLGSRAGHVSALLLDGWDALGAEGLGAASEGRGGDEQMGQVEHSNTLAKGGGVRDGGKKRVERGLLVGGDGQGAGGTGGNEGGDRGVALVTTGPRGLGRRGGEGHEGEVTAVDFRGDTGRCLTAGADGRLQAMALHAGQWVAESLLAGGAAGQAAGPVAVTAGRWRSAAEAVTGAMGGEVQLWDVRAGAAQAPVAACSIRWSAAVPHGVGAINDIAIHPSRNHLALAAASHGTVVAWDLRHLHHPLLLAGPTASLPACPTAACRQWGVGDVWEVQFDPLMHLSMLSSSLPAAATTSSAAAAAAAVPPVLACSDDGLLSLLHSDGTVRDIISVPHAINSFDVEPSFGQHVVASGYHAITYVCRPRQP